MVSYVLHVTYMRNTTYNSFAGEGGTDDKDLPVCTCTCMALPMIVGAWSMAVILVSTH